MIVVKLQGGLGNQMFQYALGRAVSLRTGADVLFDRSWYGHVPGRETARTFDLDVFDLPMRFVDEKDIPLEQRPVRHAYEPLRNALLRRVPWWRYLAGSTPWKMLFDHSKGFEEDILGLGVNAKVYVQGYWQSERYFKDQAAAVRADLVFRQAPDRENQSILDKMADDLSRGARTVSIHVRRGDYGTDPAIQAVHGLLPVGYYDAAIRMMEERFDNVVYYVFSDDLTWCRENLRFNGEAVLVDANALKPAWMDMRLMAACRHHIIANSSFSWWAAWLNAAQDKVVVAPEQWFAGAPCRHDDIVPADWLRGKNA